MEAMSQVRGVQGNGGKIEIVIFGESGPDKLPKAIDKIS
jgi:hypothetical protein